MRKGLAAILNFIRRLVFVVPSGDTTGPRYVVGSRTMEFAKQGTVNTPNSYTPMPETERLALLQRKAELEVQFGINVQPGQPVLIRAQTGQKPYVDLVVEACRARGAGRIEFDWDDIREQRAIIQDAPATEVGRVRPEMVELYKNWFRDGGARIALDGDEIPDFFEGTDPERRAAFFQARRIERSPYYDEVASKDLSQWLVAPAPISGWAGQVFPELPREQQMDALIRAVANCLRLDESNPVEAWKAHLGTLEARAAKINQLQVSELHFTGPNTDLKVRLSPRYQFLSGGSVTPKGIHFVANLPTEEIFSTPDWRGTEGNVKLTRPVVMNEVLVVGLQLEFRNGVIVASSAERGHDAFLAYTAKDEGARKLGEIALVGVDSRIFQTNRVFYSTLLDENSACHGAIGAAYLKCLKGGEVATVAELEALGCNNPHCSVHEDLMISDRSVSVTASTQKSGKVALLRDGEWVM